MSTIDTLINFMDTVMNKIQSLLTNRGSGKSYISNYSIIMLFS